jgi:mitochondrial fission protein ELM1
LREPEHLSTSPLHALLLSDGKPGHYHQAEGVIAALATLREVHTTRLEVRRRFVLPTRMLLQLVNAGAAPSRVLRLGYGLKAAGLPRADVVVSGGGETLAANAAAAKELGVPNIFCGRLRRLAPQHVSLVLVALESLAAAANHLVCLPPAPAHAAALGGSGRRGKRLGRDHPPARVAVLVGGDSGALRYREPDWSALTRFLREAHRAHGMRWLATTSRRSAQSVGDALAAMAGEAGSGLEKFVDYRTAGPGSLAAILAACDAVLCTDDSTSMISEVVGACLPLVAVVPDAGAHEPREAEFRARLAACGWYRSMAFSKLAPETFLAALEEITPRAASARDELATAIAERLPQLLAAH